MTMSDKGDKICPLCTEEMDLTDQQLKPCKCGYEICVWCWHHIMGMAEKDATEGRCPACRTPYDKERIVEMASNCSVVAETKVERKQKVQKAKPKASELRKHLGNVRVFQRNLVHVIGLPLSIADEELLKRREYFGQYGKIVKTCISRTANGTIQHSSNDCFSLYITYSKTEEAVRCIQLVHNFMLEGRCLRACFGTTKYCNSWLKNAPCVNHHCLYLHEYGSEVDSFSKEEMASAFARVQQTIGAMLNIQLRPGYVLPSPADEYNNVSPPSAPKTADKTTLPKISSPDANTGKHAGPTPTVSGVNIVPAWPSLPNSSSLTRPGKQKTESARDPVIPPPVLSAKKTDRAVINGSKKSEETLELHSNSKNNRLEATVHSVSRNHHAPSSNIKTQVFSTLSPALTTPSNLSPVHSPPRDGAQNIATSSIKSLPVSFTRQQSGSGQDKVENPNIDGELQSVSSESSSVGTYSSSLEDESSITDVPNHVNTSVGPTTMVDANFGKEGVLSTNGQAPKGSEGISHSISPPFSQGFDESTNQSSWDLWKFDGGLMGNKISSNPQATPVKPDISTFSLTPLNTALDNKWLDSSETFSSGMDKMLGCPDLFEDIRKGTSFGRYGSDVSNVNEHGTSNFGESHIISNILSMDGWEDSLASSDNFAKMFAEADRQQGSHILRNAGKIQNNANNQSRFLFAQQEDLPNQAPDLEHRFGHQAANQYLSRQNSVKIDCPHPVENRQSSVSYSGFAGYDSMPGQYFSSSNMLPESKPKVMAPPGFSSTTKAPPGFFSHERMDQAVGKFSANHLGHAPSLGSGPGHFPSNGNIVGHMDTELNDPAILEIGKRLPTTGLDQTSLNTWHNSYPRSNPSEYEVSRLQHLLQKPMDLHQNPKLVEHFGNGFSTQNNVYNTPAFSDYSQRSNLSSFTPVTNQNLRNDQLNGGYWGGLSQANNVSNNPAISDLFSNANFSGNKLIPGYEEAMFRMPGSSNQYSRGFGF